VEDKERKREVIKHKIQKMKEDRLRSRKQMKENTKKQNFIFGENRKKRLYQEMEEKFVHEVEMPELERRKHELGKVIL